MKTVSETEATKRLDAILDEAQREPIAIRRGDREIAVVLSLGGYERLLEGNIQAFLDLRNQVANEAAANGLNEQRLSDLIKGRKPIAQKAILFREEPKIDLHPRFNPGGASNLHS